MKVHQIAGIKASFVRYFKSAPTIEKALIWTLALSLGTFLLINSLSLGRYALASADLSSAEAFLRPYEETRLTIYRIASSIEDPVVTDTQEYKNCFNQAEKEFELAHKGQDKSSVFYKIERDSWERPASNSCKEAGVGKKAISADQVPLYNICISPNYDELTLVSGWTHVYDKSILSEEQTNSCREVHELVKRRGNAWSDLGDISSNIQLYPDPDSRLRAEYDKQAEAEGNFIYFLPSNQLRLAGLSALLLFFLYLIRAAIKGAFKGR